MKKILLLPMALILVFSLSGCFDLFGLPNVAVNLSGEWVAFLDGSDVENSRLVALNTATGEVLSIGTPDDGAFHGAFSWHPDGEQIAYYHISIDEVPSIHLVNINQPSEESVVIGADALPAEFWPTQLAFSPDGAYIVASMLLPAEGSEFSFDIGGNDTSETTDIAPNEEGQLTVTSVLYLIDVANGTAEPLTDPTAVFPSVLQWSPDSMKIGFVAWTDLNGDAYVDFSGAIDNPMEADLPYIYVYDLAAEELITVSEMGSMDLSPSWIDENTLAYVHFDLMLMGMSEDPAGLVFTAFDTTTRTNSAITDAGQLGVGAFGISASPDGSKIAFVGLDIQEQVAGAIGGSEEATAEPVRVYTMNADGTNLQLVYEFEFETEGETTGDSGLFVDVPVWSRDSSHIYLAVANPLLSLVGISFSAGVDDQATPEFTLPMYDIDLDNPDNSGIIYEGLFSSSGLFQSIATFAGSFSFGE